LTYTADNFPPAKF